ncbi:MAG: chloride channel protein [Eubacteriales bacterium]|nr:chloride channel protein [Eubacteriales bacterium]
MTNQTHHERASRLSIPDIGDGVIIGCLGGGAAVLFRYLLEHVADWGNAWYRRLHTQSGLSLFGWATLTCLTVVVLGLLVGSLVKRAPLSSGSGIPQVTGILQGKLRTKPLPVLLSKYVGGLAANLIGMSLGREGPSIQLGAEAAQLYAGQRGYSRGRRHRLMVAGAAAGLAAAFHAPLAAVVFTIEELRGELRKQELVVVAISALSADLLAKLCFGWQPVFRFAVVKLPGALLPWQLFWLPVLGIICGLLGGLFNVVLVRMQGLWQKLVTSVRMRVCVAFVLTFVLVWFWPALFGNGAPLLLGQQSQWIKEAGQMGAISLLSLLGLLAARLLYTCFCYGSATPGGIFLPTLVLGGMAGLIFGSVIPGGTPAGGTEAAAAQLVVWIILAMGAVLTAVTGSWLTAVLLVLEMTHCFEALLPLAATAMIALLTAKACGIEPIYETLLEKMLIKKNQ